MSQLTIRRRHYFFDCLALLLCATEVSANPCAEKSWPNEPVFAMARTEGNGDESGIGGTGHGGEGSGIGGTGHQDVPPPLRAGFSLPTDHHEQASDATGIIGVIAGFGSICVNGQEVHYGASVPVRWNGQASSSQTLALGQMVSVHARIEGGSYYANEIIVVDQVRGPIDAIDNTQGIVYMVGQRIAMTPRITASLTSGQWLSVSGSRSATDTILPTRIALQNTGNSVVLSGPILLDAQGRMHIAQMPIHPLPHLPLPANGEEVLVRGQLRGGVLHAEDWQAAPRTRFSRPVQHLDIQGYLRHASSSTLNVEGIPINRSNSLPPDTSLMPGHRISISAYYGPDGRLELERLHQAPRPIPVGRNMATDSDQHGKQLPLNTSAGLMRPDLDRPTPLRPESPRADRLRPEFSRPNNSQGNNQDRPGNMRPTPPRQP